MTPLNQLKEVEYALESTAPVSVSQPASGMRSLFPGPRGLRVGWRLLIFIGLLVALFGGAALVSHGGPQGLRNALKHVDEVTVTPFKMGASEAIAFALLCLATLAMSTDGLTHIPGFTARGCSVHFLNFSEVATRSSAPAKRARRGQACRLSASSSKAPAAPLANHIFEMIEKLRDEGRPTMLRINVLLPASRQVSLG